MITIAALSTLLFLTIFYIVHLRRSLTIRSRTDDILHSINRNINEGIYRSRVGKNLVYVNAEFIRMFGYKDAEEMLNIEVVDLFRDPVEYRQLGDELLRSGSISNQEIEFIRKDRTVFWGYLNTNRVKCKDGLTYFDGAIRDISEQKEAERQVEYHTKIQRSLINISSRYMDLTQDQVDRAFNQSLHDLGLLVDADRVYFFEYDLTENTCTNTYEWCREGIQPVIDESQHIPLEGELADLLTCHFEGSHLYIPVVENMSDGIAKEIFMQQDIKSLLSVPMIDKEDCVGFVGFDSVRTHRQYSGTEITMLKLFANLSMNVLKRTRNQNELRTVLESSIDQNKRLKEFSYITSHNFRAPVANLMGLIRLLMDDSENSEKYVKMLWRSTSQLSETLNNINKLLNFENEISILEKEPCNLSEIVGNVLELNSRIISEKTVNVSVDISDKLTVNAFAIYLESIFQNLITNALKYGVTDTSKNIKIEARKKNREIIVAVCDNGLGIDLRRHEKKLFRPGSRFHSSIQDGQGIGLFITKYQIDAMGGKIEVKSKVNEGSEFAIHFND